MPLKFKIYYACSLYVLLWTSSLVFLVAYYMITEPGNDTDTIFQFFLFFATALIIAKVSMSITAVQYYKKGKQPSKTGRVLFIIGFGIICLVAIGLLILSGFFIIPEAFMKPPIDYPRSSPDFLLDVSFLIGAICSTDIAIFDLVLLKAIRRKSKEDLLSLELGDTQQV